MTTILLMDLLSTLLWYTTLISHAKFTVHVKVMLLSVRQAFKIGGGVRVAGCEYQIRMKRINSIDYTHHLECW